MSEKYKGNRGGGTKDFKADPKKQFLIARGCSEDRAVELCVANKITLEQIPDYTDRLTILRIGQLSIDPMVDAEVIRIAKRIQSRMETKQEEPEDKGFDDQCSTCVDLGVACQVGDRDRPVEDCDHHYHKDDAEADAEIKRQDEEEQQRHAEEESEETPRRIEAKEGGVVYRCGTCDKEYKTISGLQKHEKTLHGGD